MRRPRNQGAKATKLSTDNIGRIAERDVGQAIRGEVCSQNGVSPFPAQIAFRAREDMAALDTFLAIGIKKGPQPIGHHRQQPKMSKKGPLNK